MVSKFAGTTLLGFVVACTATNSYGGGDSSSAGSYSSSGDSYGSSSDSYGSSSYGSPGSYAADYHMPCHDKLAGAACTVTFNGAVVLEGICGDHAPETHDDEDDGSYGASGNSYGDTSYGGDAGASYGGDAGSTYGGDAGSSYGSDAGSYSGDAGSSYGGAGSSYGGDADEGSYDAGSSYGGVSYGSGAYGTALFCNEPTSTSKSDDGLAGGTIAGIAIGVVIAVGLFVGAAVYCLVFKKSPAANGLNLGKAHNVLKDDVPPQMSGGVPEPTQIPVGGQEA